MNSTALVSFQVNYIGEIYKIKDNEFLKLVPTHSGGESGCCYSGDLKFIAFEKNKIFEIANFSIEIDTGIQTEDMDGDKEEEIRTISKMFYDDSFS